MEDILDEIEILNSSRKFSKSSFVAALVGVALFSYIFFNISGTMKADEGIPDVHQNVVVVMLLSCIVGVIMMILSFMTKENSTIYKWTGAVLNMLLLAVIVGSVILSIFI